MKVGDEVEYLYKSYIHIEKRIGVILKVKGFLNKKYVVERYTELNSGKKVSIGVCDTVKVKEILANVR